LWAATGTKSLDPVKHLKRLYLLLRAIPKTIVFNLVYFGFPGLRLPVIVSHRVKLHSLGGRIYFDCPVRSGLVHIGFGGIELFDQDRSRSIWANWGTVRFGGRAQLSHGSRISVWPHGTLVFGDRFAITAESSINCARSIQFGSGCLLSWDILVMDQDHHPIFDRETGRRLNPDEEIVVGRDVWIGCRSIILKGAKIGDGCVVAAGSLVVKRFKDGHQVIGGVPATVLRSHISWKADREIF
jgi:acetyltransferase-like isoleucine patch superfamily enzyme